MCSTTSNGNTVNIPLVVLLMVLFIVLLMVLPWLRMYLCLFKSNIIFCANLLVPVLSVVLLRVQLIVSVMVVLLGGNVDISEYIMEMIILSAFK